MAAGNRTMSFQRLWLRSCFSLALSTLVIVPALAQTPTSTITATPKPTSTPIGPSAYLGTTSATSSQFIYYHGGQLNSQVLQYSGELFALDVTKPWPIHSPAWINLTTPAPPSIASPVTHGHSAAMSKDESILYLTAPTNNPVDPFFYQYNVKTATWSTVSAPAAQAADWSKRREAHLLTDPNTGSVWYLGGSFPDDTMTNEIDRYQNGAWSVNLAATPETGIPLNGSTSAIHKFSAGTAHLYNSKIYLFGGFSSIGGQRIYQSFQSLPVIDYSTSPTTIRTQLTIGDVPSPRHDHCSVLTASKKVLVFGGYDANTKATFDDLWSLDLVTLTWQQIIANNPTKPRYGHTCNLAGANMIVFGGRASAGSAGPTQVGYKDVQVYDIVNASWVGTFVPKEDTTPTSQPASGIIPDAPKSGGLSTGALIGIIIGSVAVVLIIGSILLYKRRQKKVQVYEAEMEKAAYLASLASTDEGNRRQSGHRASQKHRKNNPYATSSPRSTSTRRLNTGGTSAMASPSLGHNGGYESEPGSYNSPPPPSSPPPPVSNVQYLMQQLPDGTIAVQPVYLDHQPIELQHSPNMIYSENCSLGGLMGTQMSPATNGAGVGEGSNGASSSTGSSTAHHSTSQNYFVPPPPPSSQPPRQHLSTTSNTTSHVHNKAGDTESAEVLQTSGSEDPFASPVLAVASPSQTSHTHKPASRSGSSRSNGLPRSPVTARSSPNSSPQHTRL